MYRKNSADLPSPFYRFFLYSKSLILTDSSHNFFVFGDGFLQIKQLNHSLSEIGSESIRVSILTYDSGHNSFRQDKHALCFNRDAEFDFVKKESSPSNKRKPVHILLVRPLSQQTWFIRQNLFRIKKTISRTNENTKMWNTKFCLVVLFF